jgi:transcription antitermination factor NusG
MDEAWHVVLFEPQQEFRAAAGIATHGIPPYVPAIMKKRPGGRGKFVDVKVPMFGTYGFFRARKGDGMAYRLVCSTRGVSRLLIVSGAPAVISAAEYVAIVDAEQIDRKIRPAHRYPFKAGDAVTIKGLAAQLVELDDDGRVTVLLSLFGRENRVKVKVDEVTAA